MHWLIHSMVYTTSCAWTLPCYFIGISTTICSFVDAPHTFNMSSLLNAKNFPLSCTLFIPLAGKKLEMSAPARGCSLHFSETFKCDGRLWLLSCNKRQQKLSSSAPEFCYPSLSGNQKAQGNNKAGSSAKLVGLPSFYEWRFVGAMLEGF